ncbi:MAG: CHC2 zinc finger domain-containing protein [Candidatus Omnitrophota bacterium]
MINYKIISESVDIIDAATRYGIQVNGRNKALCPFHSEKTASLSFRNNRFKCFGCGASGDVIDFVSKLHGISGADAAGTLNRDYGLHLNLTAPVSAAATSEYIQKKRRLETFRAWENKLFIKLCDMRHRMNAVLRSQRREDEPSKEFTDALSKISLSDFYIDTLIFMSESDKIEWCTAHKSEVEQFAAGGCI